MYKITDIVREEKSITALINDIKYRFKTNNMVNVDMLINAMVSDNIFESDTINLIVKISDINILIKGKAVKVKKSIDFIPAVSQIKYIDPIYKNYPINKNCQKITDNCYLDCNRLCCRTKIINIDCDRWSYMTINYMFNEGEVKTSANTYDYNSKSYKFEYKQHFYKNNEVKTMKCYITLELRSMNNIYAVTPYSKSFWIKGAYVLVVTIDESCISTETEYHSSFPKLNNGVVYYCMTNINIETIITAVI